MCCNPWGLEESDMTEHLNGTEEDKFVFYICQAVFLFYIYILLFLMPNISDIIHYFDYSLYDAK